MNKHLQNYIQIIELLETKDINYNAKLSQHKGIIDYSIELYIDNNEFEYYPMIIVETDGNKVSYEIDVLKKGNLKVLAKGFNNVINWINKQ